MKGKRLLGIWMALLLAGAGLAKAENGQGLILSSGIPVDALHFYEAAHPEEPLEFADPLTADDLARYITTQDASIDIFVVKADYNFTQLKRKGYAAPLDASQALTASLAEMDESIAQVLLDENGALVAWPHELSIWEYGINEGYWEMFWPDRPLPKTFGEVLDAWIDWERNLAQDYPGVGFMNWEFDYAYLLETFMNLYVMQHDAEGSVDFDSPELKSVLQKLQEIYEIRLAKGRSTSPDEPDTQLMVQSETGPGYIFYVTTYIAMSDRNPTPNQTPDSYLYGVPKNSITELPLVFEEETVPYTNARMYVFVVNPYSTKIDAAIRFLECMAQVEANSRLYYAIHPGENEPYPRANYEQIRDSYTQQKAEYEEAIQQAKNGLSADEIGTWLEETRFDSSIYITVATLKYLKQGGRITPAAAAIGTLLRLKPVLQIQGEKLDAFSKARTMNQAKSTMTKAIKDDIANRFGEKINLDVIHSHNLEAAQEFRKEVLATFPDIGEINIFPLSLSVSCHIGPGSLALTCSKVHPEIW